MEQYLEESASLTIEDALAGAYKKNVPNSEKAGANLLNRMAGGVQGYGDDFEHTLEQTINEATNEAEPTIKLNGQDAATSWAWGYRDTTDKSYKVMADSVASTLSKVTEINIPKSTESAMKMANTFKDSYGLTIEQSKDVVSKTVGLFVKGIEQGNLQGTGESAKNLAKEFSNKYGFNITDSERMVTSILESFIKGSTDGVMTTAGSSGTEIASEIVEKIKKEEMNRIPDLAHTESQVVQQANANTDTSSAEDTGWNIIAGLKRGMQGNPISGVLGNIANNIVGGLRHQLGIASPSKVIRDQIGKFIPLGLVKGIESTENEVYDAMNKIAENVANTNFADMSGALTLDTSFVTPNDKITSKLDAESKLSLEDSMKQVAEYCYQAIKDGFNDVDLKTDVNIGNDKVYSGYTKFKTQSENMYGTRI